MSEEKKDDLSPAQQAAMTAVCTLLEAESKGWRVPTLHELETIKKEDPTLAAEMLLGYGLALGTGLITITATGHPALTDAGRGMANDAMRILKGKGYVSPTMEDLKARVAEQEKSH